MKLSALALALAFAVPVAAHADPAPGAPARTAGVIDAGVQLRGATGKITHHLRLTTITHQCAAARAEDDAGRFEVELCHRDDATDGRVVQIKWSLQDGKRVQRHEGWAVLTTGGSVEVGAAPGKGDTLIVSMK